MKTVMGLLLVAGAYAQEGSISGIVRDNSNKAPIPGASVQLHLPGKDEMRSATTGMDGSYRFDKLEPSDRFTLLWNAEGYVGVRGPGLSMRLAKVAPGAEAKHILELVPMSSVAGTVVDEEGKPVAGVKVFVNANLRATSAEDGTYQIAMLGPGSHRLAFRAPDAYRSKTMQRNEDTGEAFGYPVVEYYPGTADVSASTPVVLAGRLALHGFDVRLRRIRLVHVAGHVTEPGIYVGLKTVTRGFEDESLKPRKVGADGEFRFDDIPEGRYLLAAYRADEDDGALPYLMPIEVGKTGIDDMKVVLPVFRSMDVITRTEDDVKWTGRVRVTLHATLMEGVYRELSLAPETLSFGVIPPGKWWVYVNGGGQSSDGNVLAADRITFGGQEAEGGQITVGESGEMRLEVHLTAHTGTIVASFPQDEGIEGAEVIFGALPANDPTNRTGMSLMTPDGTGTMRGLLPGVYSVGAALNGVTQYMAKVEVRAGETTRVRLTPVKQ